MYIQRYLLLSSFLHLAILCFPRYLTAISCFFRLCNGFSLLLYIRFIRRPSGFSVLN
ncbi:hypothetical protein DAEQUDRAFT_289905 [Daedalea quercina L-15889]|uniref:Uncharacterized protein n=1 Tax=Daedalea quercina L-15889 TaxID=1314783 RepID=A0A165TXQ7_9APHY|nr:hypothetical protein DAEQUDRAFT_289905 [Daedalea quercina L-15889]